MATAENFYINSGFSMLWFFVITTLYFVVKVLMDLKPTFTSNDIQIKAKQKTKMYYIVIYILLVVVGEFFINAFVSKSICGNIQWKTIFTVSFIPWILIFLVLCGLLIMNPGWLIPFSNTFGYAVTLIIGVNNLLDKIFKPLVEYEDDDNKSVQESLALIYSNKSLVFNEISSTNFLSFWKRLKPLMKSNINDNITIRDELYKMVIIKDSVSEYIWYMLTGLLVCSVSYNYLAYAKCEHSVSDLEKNLQKYSNKMKNNKKDIYSSSKTYISSEGT